MKRNFFKLITACAGSLILCLYSYAVSYRQQSLVNGRYATFTQSSATTYLSTATNAVYISDGGSTISSGTNSAGQFFGGWGRDAVFNGDANGGVGSLAVSVTVSNSTQTSTNGITFQFVRSIDGINFDTNSAAAIAAQGPWSFSITNTFGTNSSGSTVTTVTNVPSWFAQGARVIRLNSIAFAADAATRTNSVYVYLGSFVP